MDTFTNQYIETALWASTDESSVPLDDRFTIADIPADELQKMVRDCAAFQEANLSMIEHDLSQAGHDFWLTRNGHGAGFWDGDWPEHGQALTKACEAFSNCDLYVGDDGKVYLY